MTDKEIEPVCKCSMRQKLAKVHHSDRKLHHYLHPSSAASSSPS